MRPRDIGTRAESAVVRYLVANGWAAAERRTLKGTLDQGDITGTPGICWEVKGGEAARRASDGQIDAWLAETETERRNAKADYGVLVVQRGGIGPANAGRWWAVVRAADVIHMETGVISDTPLPVRMLLADVCHLLHRAGYGRSVNVEAATA